MLIIVSQKYASTSELLLITLMDNLHFELNWIWNHLGDTILVVSVGTFFREVKLRRQDPPGRKMAPSFGPGTHHALK